MSAVSVIAMTNSPPDDAVTHDHILRVGTVIAVVLAGVGLLSLIAVLVSAAAGVQAWAGLLFLAYACLPLAFIMLGFMVIVGLLRRRRH